MVRIHSLERPVEASGRHRGQESSTRQLSWSIRRVSETSLASLLVPTLEGLGSHPDAYIQSLSHSRGPQSWALYLGCDKRFLLVTPEGESAVIAGLCCLFNLWVCRYRRCGMLAMLIKMESSLSVCIPTAPRLLAESRTSTSLIF